MKLTITLPILLAVLLSAIAIDGFSQKGKLRLANDYFNSFKFEKAAEVYEDILKKNPEDITALRGAGVARMRTSHFDQAENHFAALTKIPTSTDKDLLDYAYVLKIQRKYDEAVVVYEKYLSYGPDPYLEGYTYNDWATRIIRDSARFEIRETQVNSANSDFAPAFTENGMVFSSSRKQGKGKRKIYAWNDQSYLNLYTCEITPDSNLTNAKVMKNQANSRYHEGTITYDPVHKIMYFTRNNFLKGKKNADDDGTLKLGIFYASYADGKIGKVKPFPFNEPEFSVGHPSISADGRKMYFVSDMEGGYGGTDIYVSVRNLDFWSPPVNLGPKINTPGNEMFPSTDSRGTLYFASDYHPGLGGLDLFYTSLEDSAKVKNFGYPINSSYDDFSLIAHADGLSGYYTSNRPGGQGDDDIYAFVVHPVSTIICSGKVFDLASGDHIPNATILVRDPATNSVQEVSVITDEAGNFRVELPFASTYELVGSKDGYFDKAIQINNDGRTGFVDDVELYLTAMDYASEGTVYFAFDGSPVSGALVTLKSLDGTVLGEKITDDDGGYFFGLDPESQYIIEASLDNYPTQTVVIDTRGLDASVIHSDIRMFNYEKGTIVQLDNIYYNYDQATIRSDAQRDLDRLTAILKSNPSMRIELRSHTDSRGTDSYNLRLSDRRAKAAVDYLIKKGIAPKRLVWKGYGETELLNNCVNDADCSETEHQKNRRTEFKILDI
jgi:outer membrane protein OmpA-like peptidoglycan-associated protein/tetratricopeptide (TPR) repeat protein